MIKLLNHFAFAFILLFGAAFMLITHDSGTVFPTVLFPIWMIISGLGSFLHGPVDPVVTNFNKIPLSERIGVVLLFTGMIFMILAAVLKAFG